VITKFLNKELLMREEVPISTLTTMQIGGPARYVREILDSRALRDAYSFAKDKNLPVFILGSGSNTIATDAGFPGIILQCKIRGIEIVRELAGTLVLKGGAGESLDRFIEFATKRGYSGMEALSGIPGTLGAAPVQNVGAYGQEISHVLESVDVFDTRTFRFEVLPASKLHLSYRRSIFNSSRDAGRYFITRVTVRLKRTQLQPPFYTSLQAYIDKHKITDFSPATIRQAVTAIRAEKLPDPSTIPSAGSFFKNITLTDQQAAEAKEKGIEVWTENGIHTINSGWLIEQSGLKGEAFHGFRISDKAALILINESATTYEQLAATRKHIQDTVKAKFGFTLEQEPNEIS
jgi:UDP-N-acetylmuramate dehydrogenase